MSGLRLALVGVLATVLLATSRAIEVDDFYPFDKNSVNHLARADSAWSNECNLLTPIKYYNRTFTSLWVHTDGFISFSNEEFPVDSVMALDFPLTDSLIAPYMADLDISEHGHIVYDESQDADVLARAGKDVRSAFPEAARNFEPLSVFVATWKNVKGLSLEGEPASFSFQLALVSSDEDSFAIFLYPKRRMGEMEAGKTQRTSMFDAKAGFSMGSNKFMEMYPAEDLVDYDNTARKGQWIFQIGGEGVVRLDDVVDPEKRRMVRRDALVNVQEVDLSDSFNDDDFEDDFGQREQFNYCARDGSACNVNNSICVNHNEGYCCQCERGFVGNGRICADAYQNLMISGNVTGTVDIRDSNGVVNRVKVDSQYQGFSIVDLGRSHAALTPVPASLGAALKGIVPIGEISAWLFASSVKPAINGFDYTGGRFQRQLSIRFHDGGYRFDMRQRFHGAYFNNNELFVNATGHCVGVLPAVSLDQLMNFDETTESIYIREAPGRITMSNTFSFEADGQTYNYDVTETIIFSECAESRNAVPSRLTLRMSNIFVQSDENTVRWAQDAKVEVSDKHAPTYVPKYRPCDNNDCGPGECVPSSNHYRCRCPDGFRENTNSDGKSTCQEEGLGIDNPCEIDGICGVGTCVPNGNLYECICPDGYLAVNDNGYGSCQAQQAELQKPCEVTGICGRVGQCRPDQDGYRCDCPRGYHEIQTTYGYRCEDIDECQSSDCSPYADCINTDGAYECRCRDGFTGNGRDCVRDSACERERQFAQERPRRFYTPECTDDGRFQRKQCSDGSDVCWCVNEDTGEEIRGTRGDGRYVRCDDDVSSGETDCQRQYREGLLRRRQNPSAAQDFLECTDDGLYEKRQCTNYEDVCWCVDQETGATIDGTMSEQGMGHLVDCDRESDETECERRYRAMAEYKDAHPESDTEFPDCTVDGLFNKRQCEGFGETCWCVDPYTGDEVPGTRSLSRQGLEVDCDSDFTESVEETECQRQYRQADERRSQAQDTELPLCDSNGLFSKRQCIAFLDICRCVDPYTGATISGTETREGEGHLLNCDYGSEGTPQTECARQYAAASLQQDEDPTSDVRLPDCNADGTFVKRQCDSYDDTCWCVDTVTGDEQDGTRTAPGQGMSLTCETGASGACEPNPCGVGECIEHNGQTRCRCPAGYEEVFDASGSTCEEAVVPESGYSKCGVPNPCGEVGECVDMTNAHHRCRCPDGYTEVAGRRGSRCQELTDSPDYVNCADETEPCGGVGVCVDRANGNHRCRCPQGYDEVPTDRGSTCQAVDQQPIIENDFEPVVVESNFTNCEDDPFICGEVGECVEQSNSNHRCRCPQGYNEIFTDGGSRCQAEPVAPEPEPEVEVEVELEEFFECDDPFACGEVGECIEQPSGVHHRCRCPEGYFETLTESGSRCQAEATEPVTVAPACEDRHVCGDVGECVPQLAGGYRCRCPDGYLEVRKVDGGRKCEALTNIDTTNHSNCDDHVNPCGPVGECVDRPHAHHRCRCPSGYVEVHTDRGSRCAEADSVSIEFSKCDEPNPCGRVGDCIEFDNANHRCRCYPGYYEVQSDHGSKCEAFVPGKLVDEETTEPSACDDPFICGDIGDCVEGRDGGYRCLCPRGYNEVNTASGSKCQEVVAAETTTTTVPTTTTTTTTTTEEPAAGFSECGDPDPCGPGECVPRDNGHHRCRCPLGFVEVPTRRGSICEEAGDICEKADNPCSGHGSCVPQSNTFRCRCDAGYEEYFRDGHGDCHSTTTSPCSSDPCGRHGECVADNSSYRCRCTDGYEEVFENGQSRCREGEGSGVEEVEESECERQLRSGQLSTNGGVIVCLPNGDFSSPQCDVNDEQCWCVDAYTGDEIDGTRTSEELVDCEEANFNQSTACQDDKFRMQAYFQDPSGQRPEGLLYEPDCTEAGAYEPLQYHNGYYICVDFNGLEVSRHRQRPQCMQPCELAAYYAQTENIFTGTDNFVPKCTQDGQYERAQCELPKCWCVDENGREIEDMPWQRVRNAADRRRFEQRCRTLGAGPVRTTTPAPVQYTRCNDGPNPCGPGECVDMRNANHRCRCPREYREVFTNRGSNCRLRGEPPQLTTTEAPFTTTTAYTTTPYQYEPVPPKHVIFAQASGLQSIDLPWNDDSHAVRMYDRPSRMFVGVDYNCDDGHVYFTDVRDRVIYRAPANNMNDVEVIVRRSIRSPEGVAVDHLSGNLYWVDSGTKRIEVSRTDGSMRKVILSKGLVNPRGIAVDPVGGKLYWSDWNRLNPKIMVANMDGTDAQVLVKDGLKLPNDVEIDPFHKRLCFIDAGTYKIECMSLDGRGRRVVADLSQGSTSPRMAFGLEVSGRYVYYTDRKAARIHQIDIQSGDDKVMRGPMGVHGQMFGITLSYDECPQETNYCARNNGGCPSNKLCLPVPNGRTCKCPKHDKKCKDEQN